MRYELKKPCKGLFPIPDPQRFSTLKGFLDPQRFSKINNEESLKQIKEKKYYEKYLSVNKEIYLIGIVFDEKERNITKFTWEKV